MAVSPDGRNVYVASGLGDALAAFARDSQTGTLTQLSGTSGCMVAAIAMGCGLGRAFEAPEGVAVSLDGRNVYVGAFGSSAVGTFVRSSLDGSLTQPRDAHGCIVDRSQPLCLRGRALRQANAIAVSPDGRNVYVDTFGDNAIAVFGRSGASGRIPPGSGRSAAFIGSANQ